MSSPSVQARAAERWRVKNAVGVVLLALVVIGGSGNARWVGGWAYVAMMAVLQTLLYQVLRRVAPDLMVERSRMQPGTKVWDKVMVPVIAVVLPFVIWIVAALDERYGWTQVSGGWRAVGFLFVAAGMALTMWAMVSNPFFSATVRIQGERGQIVIERGPYAFLRHPGYAGAILFTLGTPLALDSWYALWPAGICVVLTVVRTALEDRTLRAELNGYEGYALRVRERLIPAIW